MWQTKTTSAFEARSLLNVLKSCYLCKSKVLNYTWHTLYARFTCKSIAFSMLLQYTWRLVLSFIQQYRSVPQLWCTKVWQCLKNQFLKKSYVVTVSTHSKKQEKIICYKKRIFNNFHDHFPLLSITYDTWRPRLFTQKLICTYVLNLERNF